VPLPPARRADNGCRREWRGRGAMVGDFVPPGFIALRDAVDLAGRSLFGAEWSGKEVRKLRSPPPKRQIRRLEDAVALLRGHLSTGKVQARALAEDGTVFEVRVAVWLSRNGRSVFDTGLLPFGDLREAIKARGERKFHRRILVHKSDIERAFPGRPAQATVAAEVRCRKWLAGLMQKGPPEGPKRRYQAQAKEKFGVGPKAFNRAWANAVAETGNAEWSKPGRKS